MEIVTEATDARVLRSFAFLDVCGFTSIIDASGDAAAVGTLAEFRRRVRDACGRHGVRVAKWLGDGAMVVGVEPERLARGVWEIVDDPDPERPRIRAGFAFGEVLVFEGDDYIGCTVNLAGAPVRRGTTRRAPRRDRRRELAGHSLPLQPRDPIAIRGFRVPVSVRSIGSTSEGSVGQPPRGSDGSAGGEHAARWSGCRPAPGTACPSPQPGR